MSINPGSDMSLRLRADDEVSFVPMEAIGEYGGLTLDQARTLGEISGGYTEFQDGDVVLAKITPCFENGKGALASGLTNRVAFGTTELHVLRAHSGLERRFLFYLSISSIYRKMGEAEMYGAGGQKRVPPDFVKDFRVPTPPPDEQGIIADFLDRETTKIDALIAKKRGLIEKLKEKRSALISRTVTRGLPPKAARAAGLDPHPPLKPSGVDWLGEIPWHWSASRLKYAASRIVDCPHETPKYMDNGEYTAIRTADLSAGKLDLSAAYRLEEEEYLKRIRRESLRAGDIVYGREGERWGFAATVPDRADLCLGQRMMQFRAAGHFDERFLIDVAAQFGQRLSTRSSRHPRCNISPR
jgi:type I restriction enzyme S subunit